MARPSSRSGAPAFGPVAASVPPAKRPAPHRVVLKPSDFADTWTEKGSHDVTVGLRLVSETVLADAEKHALRGAQNAMSGEAPPDFFELRKDLAIEQYNREVKIAVLAHALCRHDDVTTHYFPKAPNALVPLAFRDDTIALLWTEYCLLRKSLNPTSRLATDDEMAVLMPDPSKATTLLRRLVALAHEELERVLHAEADQATSDG